jgi:DNA-binding IclR family transcriptional regulator
MIMRKSAAWMSIWDDRILEYIQENDGGSVGEMADHDLIRISNAHVSRRCKRLAEHGLLRALGNGVYMLTEKGVQYLNEELDADDLKEPDGEKGATSA